MARPSASGRLAPASAVVPARPGVSARRKRRCLRAHRRPAASSARSARGEVCTWPAQRAHERWPDTMAPPCHSEDSLAEGADNVCLAAPRVLAISMSTSVDVQLLVCTRHGLSKTPYNSIIDLSMAKCMTSCSVCCSVSRQSPFPASTFPNLPSCSPLLASPSCPLAKLQGKEHKMRPCPLLPSHSRMIHTDQAEVQVQELEWQSSTCGNLSHHDYHEMHSLIRYCSPPLTLDSMLPQHSAADGCTQACKQASHEMPPTPIRQRGLHEHSPSSCPACSHTPGRRHSHHT